MSAPLAAQDGEREAAGNGILCLHMTMISMLAAAKECHPVRDRDYISALEETIAEFDEFVLRNHPDATREILAEFHKHHAEVGRRAVREESGCRATRHGILGIYESFRDNTPPEKLREMTETMLAVGRVPTINPCF